MDRDGTELANEDLPKMTVAQLRSCFGGPSGSVLG